MENTAAAQYLRVSTERQEYSLDFQSSKIAMYARDHGFAVCQTYCDEAKSGMEIGHRAGLSQLIQDVVGGEQSYRAILVYDVSRWGRFQDPDEAAYYEFMCKAAGVQVHYCAEHFSNDGQIANLILKTLKRVMAAEYSRELSEKVLAGMTRLVQGGFRTGSHPGYGFRRQLMSANGVLRQQLSTGERKSIANDRVVLVPGPAHEIFWVEEIYRLFISGGKNFAGIAAELERRGAPYLRGSTWSDHAVKKILTHPKYKGTAVYNRTSEKLCSKWRRVPEAEWIVKPNAFKPLVGEVVFAAAQEKLKGKFFYRTNESIIEQLRLMLKVHGRLTTAILRKHGLSASSVCARFGSMVHAYDLVGYQSKYKTGASHRLHVQKIRSELMQQIVDLFPQKLSIFSWGTWQRRNCLKFKNQLRVGVRICRSVSFATKGRMWALQASRKEPYRLTLVAGMNSENTAIETLYVTSRLTNWHRLHVTEAYDKFRQGVRLEDLRSFYDTVIERRKGLH